MKGTSSLMSATKIGFISVGLSLILKSTSPSSEGDGPVYLGKEKGQMWCEEKGSKETMEGIVVFFSYISAKIFSV